MDSVTIANTNINLERGIVWGSVFGPVGFPSY